MTGEEEPNKTNGEEVKGMWNFCEVTNMGPWNEVTT